jgi:arginine decarboxylase
MRISKEGYGVKALKRQVTTAFSDNDPGRTYHKERPCNGHISPVEMRVGQPDFFGIEGIPRSAGYEEVREATNVVIETPTKFFLVSGSSEGFTLLNAFDGALLVSGVGDTNLVKMSSILPPGCQEMTPRPVSLPQGALVPIAYASLCSDAPGEVISAAVAIGIPEDGTRAGLIMEYSARAEESVVKAQVKKMVEKGMDLRNRAIKEIMAISATCRVTGIGAVFAGVVLWK